MKTSQLSLFLAEVLLVGTAIAQPHAHHAHNLDKREVIITTTIMRTVQAPDALVYVDEHGRRINAPAPTPRPPPVRAPAPAAAAPTRVPPPPPVTTPPTTPTPQPAAPAPLPAVPAPPPAVPAPPPAVPDPQAQSIVTTKFVPDSNAGAHDGFLDSGPAPYGVTWTGYKGDEVNSACKTFEDADYEWSHMGAFEVIRVYGTDCDQPSITLRLGKKYNKRVILGVYWLDERLGGELAIIVDAIKANGNNWNMVDTIAIGNEDVHRGEQTTAGIFRAVAQSRVQLRLAGYRGPIVHIDSQDAILANPGLCSRLAGDYIAANIHAFFNPNTPASKAGDFVAGQVDALRACGAGKKRKNVRVRVTETGWPKLGDTNGAAVPSKANQEAAIASIKAKLDNDVILFSAYDNLWMHNSRATFNSEHAWGILDA